MNCIVSGKKDDVAKLIGIKSKGYFERVYGVYVALKQSNMYDISMRVAKAIEHRYKELQQGIINTQIKISDNTNNDEKDVDKDKIIAEQAELIQANEKKLEEIESKFDNLMKLMEKLTNINSNENTNSNDNSDLSANNSEVQPDTPRRRGRPATK